jgi:dihydrofolate reductase
MRRIFATEYMALDGVFEEPGTWPFNFWSDEAAKFKFDELMASDALLLGRKTYEGFAAAWPNMTDEAGFAHRMNSFPKYVVSTTLDTAEWNNSHLIKENIIEEVTKLKQEPGQDIMIAGSGQLLQTLLENHLVDEVRIMLHPVVLGSGAHLFKDGIEAFALKLTGTQTFGSGIVILHYEPVASE